MYREEPYTDMKELVKNDMMAQKYGMELVESRPGSCRVSMKVRRDMLNAYGATHGAVIYALTDVAFAVTCNSGGVKSVALAMNINYRRPAQEGEVLTAEGCEESAGKTTALCRIKVTNGEGKLVAVADGLAFRQRQ